MNRLARLLEESWLWTYTAGMPPAEAEDRRSEVRSDWWEYQRFANEKPDLAGGRLRRLFAGAADDIAWRGSFGLRGLSAARSYETILLLGVTALLLVVMPASAWWAVALARNTAQPSLQIWYIGTEAVGLACTVVGGAASAAHYPRAGRVLVLAGTLALAATLWWAPIVAVILVVASVATVLSLPARSAF